MNTVIFPGNITVHQGHALECLRQMESNSVHCCVTSPPYWGLRDYGGEPQIWGGDSTCSHQWGEGVRTPWANDVPGPGGSSKNPASTRHRPKTTGPFCAVCGAWYGQLGLEPTPELFVEHLTSVFREVYRVLRPDGTLWLNLSDTWATRSGAGSGALAPLGGREGEVRTGTNRNGRRLRPERSGCEGKQTYRSGEGPLVQPNRLPLPNHKPKDLIGIPWMVAFALRQDGWYLRMDSIWHKPNGMPESVEDRPTRNHEYVFLLSKSYEYYYDADAIAEPSNGWKGSRFDDPRDLVTKPNVSRKRRNVEGIQTRRPQYQRALELALQHGLTQAHLDAIRAHGLSDAGQGALLQNGSGRNAEEIERLASEAKAVLKGYYREFLLRPQRNARSVWSIPTKPCGEAHYAAMPLELAERCILAGCPERGTVLDPFGGSGTTAIAARRVLRQSILCELTESYIPMMRRRLNADQAVLFL